MRPLHVRHSITGKTYVAWDSVWRLETEDLELIPTVLQSQILLGISQYLRGGGLGTLTIKFNHTVIPMHIHIVMEPLHF